MSWEIVREELLQNVVTRMTPINKEKGERWVDLLGQTLDGQRLGACIVIDFRCQALEPDIFASILDYLDFSNDDAQRSACWAFHNAVMNHPKNQHRADNGHFACASDFKVESSTPDAYVRVLDLGAFITYVLDTNENPMSH